jgi:hypothetical protein
MSEWGRNDANSGVLGLLLEVIADPAAGYRALHKRGFRWESVLIPLVLLVGVACVDLLVRLGGDDARIWLKVPSLLASDEEGFRAFAHFSSVIYLVVGMVLSFLVSTLVLWLVGCFLASERLNFRDVMAVSGMGLSVPILGGAATVLLVLASGNGEARFSVAFLFGVSDSSGGLGHLMACIHLFHLWYVMVLGVGLSSLTGLGIRLCLAVCGAIWILPRLLAI